MRFGNGQDLMPAYEPSLSEIIECNYTGEAE